MLTDAVQIWRFDGQSSGKQTLDGVGRLFGQ